MNNDLRMVDRNKVFSRDLKSWEFEKALNILNEELGKGIIKPRAIIMIQAVIREGIPSV